MEILVLRHHLVQDLGRRPKYGYASRMRCFSQRGGHIFDAKFEFFCNFQNDIRVRATCRYGKVHEILNDRWVRAASPSRHSTGLPWGLGGLQCLQFFQPLIAFAFFALKVLDKPTYPNWAILSNESRLRAAQFRVSDCRCVLVPFGSALQGSLNNLALGSTL